MEAGSGRGTSGKGGVQCFRALQEYASPPGARTEGGPLDKARLIRRVRFTATHRYGVPGGPTEGDRARFGDQAEAHEHRWTVEIHVVGPVDEDTGWLTDLMALDEALDEITRGWDGGDLNDRVPPVSDGRMQPSTENLARWLYRALKSRVEPPAALDQVRIFEGPDLGSAFPA